MQSAGRRPAYSLGFGTMVTVSDSMQSVFQQIERVAQTDATVLVRGESGTGKELVAGAIHRASPRREGPFSAVNMAAVPETLVESELFGHVRGAFTGAAADREGRFEVADGGTLFVDEIGDLRPTSQAKLLRVLENHHVTPVGGNRTKEVDVRVIAATNKDLEAMVACEEFREDLYYRLNVVAIELPPLRERREDVPLLVEHFLQAVCRANDRLIPEVDGELMSFLQAHRWPGNIRQLRNCIESMVVLAEGDVLIMDDLPAMLTDKGPWAAALPEVPEGCTLEELEKAAILQTLDRTDGNRTQAAQTLGISVRTLQRKLRRWQSVGEDENGRARPRPPKRSRRLADPPLVAVG